MASPAPRPKALVVEDDDAIRELLRVHLDLAGFTIDEAADSLASELVTPGGSVATGYVAAFQLGVAI